MPHASFGTPTRHLPLSRASEREPAGGGDVAHDRARSVHRGIAGRHTARAAIEDLRPHTEAAVCIGLSDMLAECTDLSFLPAVR